MIRCRGCGLELPAFASFCARCGLAQTGVRRRAMPVPIWIVVLFAAGTTIAALAAITYGAWTADPSLDPVPGLVSITTTGTLAVAAAAMVLLQSAAVAGLVRGRRWGRVVATIACLGWAATCIGLPVSFVVLLFLWKPAPAARP